MKKKKELAKTQKPEEEKTVEKEKFEDSIANKNC